jgi:hypothetical protein
MTRAPSSLADESGPRYFLARPGDMSRRCAICRMPALADPPACWPATRMCAECTAPVNAGPRSEPAVEHFRQTAEKFPWIPGTRCLASIRLGDHGIDCYPSGRCRIVHDRMTKGRPLSLARQESRARIYAILIRHSRTSSLTAAAITASSSRGLLPRQSRMTERSRAVTQDGVPRKLMSK